MNCREFVDFLMSYLDGELPGGQRAVFEEHLRRCPPCEVYLDSYQQTIELGKRACCEDEGPVPDDVPEPLIQAILAARKEGS